MLALLESLDVEAVPENLGVRGILGMRGILLGCLTRVRIL